jgi:hypothetical protein
MRRHPGVSRVNRSATPDADTQPAGWTQTSSAPGNDRRTSRSPSSRVRTQRPRYATPATRDILRPEWMTQPDLSGMFTRLSGLQLLLTVSSYTMALTATLPCGAARFRTRNGGVLDGQAQRHRPKATQPRSQQPRTHESAAPAGRRTARHQRPITGERKPAPARKMSWLSATEPRGRCDGAIWCTPWRSSPGHFQLPRSDDSKDAAACASFRAGTTGRVRPDFLDTAVTTGDGRPGPDAQTGHTDSTDGTLRPPGTITTKERRSEPSAGSRCPQGPTSDGFPIVMPIQRSKGMLGAPPPRRASDRTQAWLASPLVAAVVVLVAVASDAATASPPGHSQRPVVTAVVTLSAIPDPRATEGPAIQDRHRVLSW